MIHSLCGGRLKDNEILTVIKVKFLNNPMVDKNRPYFYICKIGDIKVGDKVLAPYNENSYAAMVIRVDASVSEQTLPFPRSKMQTVDSRFENMSE